MHNQYAGLSQALAQPRAYSTARNWRNCLIASAPSPVPMSSHSRGRACDIGSGVLRVSRIGNWSSHHSEGDTTSAVPNTSP